MTTDSILNIPLKKSNIFFVSSGLIALLFLVLIKLAQITPTFKLIIVILMIALLLQWYYVMIFIHNFQQLDILFHINSIIAWKDQKTELYDITSWYNIGSWCIVIRVSLNSKSHTILLFRDSCDNSQFRMLTSRIRWQKQN